MGIRDFPSSITVQSSGPAGKAHPQLMGTYELDTTRSAQLRPVYRKTDLDVFIYYTTHKSWMIDRDITNYSGKIKGAQTGLQTIPTHGWLHAQAGRFVVP